jgi:hypothetical protein
MIAGKSNEKQAVRDWDSYYESFIASVNAESNETESEKKERIRNLEANFEKWKLYYFPKYCSSPAAAFHKKAAKRELANPEWYESRVWARELAKDVVEMIVTLYQTLTGLKSNILFISNSWDKAAELLEPYRINLERNERIINDYGFQKMAGSWTYGDFVTTQKVSFLAVGADQSPRGSRNEEVRPDKVIISDIDTDEDVRNPEIVKKRFSWFERAVFPTRSVSLPFQVIWLGNLMAKHCCIALSMEKADKVDMVNLEDEEGNSTWPEKNSLEHIARIKEKISLASYMTEYMNKPGTEGTTFKEIRWDAVPPLSRFRFLIAYGDPAPSNKENKNNCFKAVPLIGILDGTFYIITCFLEQVKNSKFITWFYDIEDFVMGKTQIYNYIENNSLQDPFYEQVLSPLMYAEGIARQHYIHLAPDERSKPDKFARIEGNLEHLNRTGKLIFNIAEKNNPHMVRLEEQFKAVNPQLSAPADGPDAVEGGVWIINNKMAAFAGEVKSGRHKSNSKRY